MLPKTCFMCPTYSLSNKETLATTDVIFQRDESTLTAQWLYYDTELNDYSVQDNIAYNWYTVGTSPYSNDQKEVTYMEVTENGEKSLEIGAVVPSRDGMILDLVFFTNYHCVFFSVSITHSTKSP